jgi:hypothetical protein
MQADKWGNSGEGDNGQTSRNANVLRYSESAANLLVDNGSNFAIFSECALISKEKLSDFDSVVRRFEFSRPSQLIYLIAIEFFTSRFPGCVYRKPQPVMTSDLASVLAYKFPVPSQKFPVLLCREFRCKPLNLLACQLSKSFKADRFR